MLSRLPLALFFAPIICCSLGASPIITTELLSFTSSVTATVGLQTCTDAFTCSLTDGSPNGSRASATVAGGDMFLDLGLTAVGGWEDTDGAHATASVSMQEQVTIMGGTGTGIAVLCVGGHASYIGYPGLSFNVGLSGQRESAYVGDGCAGPFPVSAAADFIYGVPFDLTASMTANAGDPWADEANELSADAPLSIVVVDPPDPPDPPAAIPEPSSMVPCLILGGYAVARRFRAVRRSS